MPLALSIVTAERTILSREDVQRLVVPASEGQITVLPSHAPLMTSLGYGALTAYCPGEIIVMAVFGGFLQVAHDQVIILADAAERPTLQGHIGPFRDRAYAARGRLRRAARARRSVVHTRGIRPPREEPWARATHGGSCPVSR